MSEIDYAFWFWGFLFFVLGRLSKIKVYIGTEKDKYEKSELGVLLKERT